MNYYYSFSQTKKRMTMQTKDSTGEEKRKLHSFTVEDTTYQTFVTPAFEKRKPWQKPDENKILSSLPGTAIKINVQKGDTVKVGQPILVFEAMKMMNTVTAYRVGVIKDIFVKPGDKFSKNHLVFEFE
jgi:biotin carboxyl carrier protein